MRKPYVFILKVIFFLLIATVAFPLSAALAGKRGYFASGQSIIIIDAETDEVVSRAAAPTVVMRADDVAVPGEKPVKPITLPEMFAYDAAYFSGANVMVLVDGYSVYAYNPATFALIKILVDGKTDADTVRLLQHPSGNEFYIWWTASAEANPGANKLSVVDKDLNVKTLTNLPQTQSTMSNLDPLPGFSRDGSKLYVAYVGEKIVVVDVNTKAIIKELPLPYNKLEGKKYSVDFVENIVNGKMLVSGDLKTSAGLLAGATFVFDPDREQVSVHMHGYIPALSGACLLFPDGTKIVCDEDYDEQGNYYRLGKLHFKDVQTGQEIKLLNVGLQEKSSMSKVLAITPDSKKLYYYDYLASKVIVIDLTTYEVIKVIENIGTVSMTFSGY